MPAKPLIKYTRAVIICHGKSEVIFTQNIKSNLRLKMEIDSKKMAKAAFN